MKTTTNTPHPSGITAEWDWEDWNFTGDLIKKHWGFSSTCFSPSELGYSYDKAAKLTPYQAVEALLAWINESLQHHEGEVK